MVDVSTIEKMIEAGRDSYEARLAVGQAHLKQGHFGQAIEHLAKACEMSPQKTVAWQVLGQAHEKNNAPELAKESWRKGIEVAHANGDQQAQKVMAVWLKRLD